MNPCARFGAAAPIPTIQPLKRVLLLLVVWPVAPSLPAQEPAPPVATTAAAPVQTLSLEQCLALAAQRQPALAAQRASYAAAAEGARALDRLWIPYFLAPDLSVRRQQACLGVSAAAAGINRAERDTVYAVTRTYYTVLYAREQERVTRTVVDRLNALANAVEQQLKAGSRDITQNDADRTSFYVDLAETRRLEAAAGDQRALAALKEAIGLEPDAAIDVPTSPLMEPTARPSRDEVIAAALRHRPDVVQANTFAAVSALEVDAQSRSRRLRMTTFATGADIHARQVPQTNHNHQYAPGSEPPEMPDTLVGHRCERVQRAGSLSERASALAVKTRDLIALEAEDAFHRWEEAAAKVVRTRRAAETGDRLADNLRKDFTSLQKVRVDDVLNAQVMASQARGQYNQYLYEEILALADLERITAGTFCAGLTQPIATPAPAPAATPAEPPMLPATDR